MLEYAKNKPINIKSNPTIAGFLLSLYIPSLINLVFILLSIPTRQEAFMEIAAVTR